MAAVLFIIIEYSAQIQIDAYASQRNDTIIYGNGQWEMGKVGNEANFFICKVLLLRVQYGVGKMKYRDVRDAQRRR